MCCIIRLIKCLNKTNFIYQNEDVNMKDESNNKEKTADFQLDFIENKEFRCLLLKKLKDANLCIKDYPFNSWILHGFVLEGVLKESIKQYIQQQIENLSLNKLINKAYEIDFFAHDSVGFAHELRNFRNYIHPKVYKKTAGELAGDYNYELYIAHICVEIFSNAIASIENNLNNPTENLQIKDLETKPYAQCLALLTIIGSWDENKDSDKKIISGFIDNSYNNIKQKIKIISDKYKSIFVVKDNIYTINNKVRVTLLKQLITEISDENLKKLKDIAVTVLTEINPLLGMKTENINILNIKSAKYSNELKQGISEGLAILATVSNILKCKNHDEVKTCKEIIETIFNKKDVKTWGSLTSLLPNLAEIHPDAFINKLEQAFNSKLDYFDLICSEEILDNSHRFKLISALEVLAHDPDYFNSSCVILSQFADRYNYDDNLFFNSLVKILLAWMPQLIAASIKDQYHTNTNNICIKTIKNIFTKLPSSEIPWKLLINLLPNNTRSAFDLARPKWRKQVPDDYSGMVTYQKYYILVNRYANLAVKYSKKDINRMVDLINNLENLYLCKQAYKDFIKQLKSQKKLNLAEDYSCLLWENINKVIRKNKCYHDTNWALPEEQIAILEKIAKQLKPTDIINLHKHLFIEDDTILYEKPDNWDEQSKTLANKRKNAVKQIFNDGGIDKVLELAEKVESPYKVGEALTKLDRNNIEKDIFPDLLDITNRKLISGFIENHGNKWSLYNNLDKNNWSVSQKICLLINMPFNEKTWQEVEKLDEASQQQYWENTKIFNRENDNDTSIAVKQLLKYQLSHKAVELLYYELMDDKKIEASQCRQALVACKDNKKYIESHKAYIIKLINFLQQSNNIKTEEVEKVESLYFPLLKYEPGFKPKFAYKKLSTSSDVFSESIKSIAMALNNSDDMYD